MNDEDAFSLNEKELMDYYRLHGSIGKLMLRIKILYSWILHSLAYSSPHSGFAIRMQLARGVKIGKNLSSTSNYWRQRHIGNKYHDFCSHESDCKSFFKKRSISKKSRTC
jgi:hypothetical protein